MENVTAVTAPPMRPDGVDADAVRSKLVCTVTEPLAWALLPMVTPVSVTVTAVLAASAVPPVVMTMEAAPGAAGDSVALAVDSAAAGVGDVAKKPDG
jgi:hypothetical protein